MIYEVLPVKEVPAESMCHNTREIRKAIDHGYPEYAPYATPIYLNAPDHQSAVAAYHAAFGPFAYDVRLLCRAYYSFEPVLQTMEKED